ncbi:MAG: envelope integrity protein Cei [Gordonia sp. (in: high G+C Gram-positive bacteria)]|uniref:envelope integrity protein Cei n=1 Tax=Gordonia sp. (in: high G+C Gram-positive bacteria) TaxID=84139 RepID=UPI003BB62498
MVSQFATGYATDAQGRRFKRRNFTPAIIIGTVLTVAALAAWTFALVDRTAESYPTDCAMPTKSDVTMTPTGRGEMLAVPPAAQSTFRVTVLNSAAARGSARSVSDDLVRQGFAAGEPAFGDDAVYTERDLNCVAQIRYGPGGQTAAAAVWLAVPCAQLVNDGRPGADVDVALGEYWHAPASTQEQQAALESLRTVDPRNPKSGVDASLIEAVHNQPC